MRKTSPGSCCNVSGASRWLNVDHCSHLNQVPSSLQEHGTIHPYHCRYYVGSYESWTGTGQTSHCSEWLQHEIILYTVSPMHMNENHGGLFSIEMCSERFEEKINGNGWTADRQQHYRYWYKLHYNLLVSQWPVMDATYIKWRTPIHSTRTQIHSWLM